jgi:CRISPR-associated protein Cmr3
MMPLFLEPEDVWLFRDGRPFDSDGSRRAESLFPPYPSVIQGAVRTYELYRQQIDLSDKEAIETAVGTIDNYRELRIHGPFIARKEGKTLVRYFPQPADALSLDTKKHTLQRKGRPCPAAANVITNMPDGLSMNGLDDPPTKGESGLWLSETELRKYFHGEEVQGVKSCELFLPENRIGIGMDNTRRAVKTGMLYEVAFIRPRPDVGLYIEVEGYTGWPDTGILRLGGESRLARFSQVEALPALNPKIQPLGPLFNLYFATPAYLKEGWTTDWGKFFTQPVQLISAAVNRYESLGGFDYAASSHKPARRYIPAGSVYTFEVKNNSEVQLKDSPISEYGAEIGFGQGIAYPVNQEEMKHV